MSFKFIQAKKAYLTSPIASTDVSILLTGFKDIYGNTLTMAMFGSIGYITIEPTSADRQEIVSFTGITDNGDGTVLLTGCTRGLLAVSTYGTGGTASDHGATSIVVVSNNPQLYNQLAVKQNNETITGFWEVPDPLTAGGIANRGWVLSMISGGSVSYDATIIPGTAGETLVAGNLVYLKMSDQRWWKVDVDDTTTFIGVDLGIAQGSGTAGNSISGGVLLGGQDDAGTYTAGQSYYASNTAGALVTTTDQTNVVFVGSANASNKLIFNPRMIDIPTHKEKQAMAGSQGVPSSTNKFVTADNRSAAGTDQSQTTQNATIEFGETDASGRKFKIGQSFIPTKTKIRGVRLYKIADTGVFTGTVTLSLFVDAAGIPSGASLASKTISNWEWLSLSVGAIDVLFSSEYSSIVQAGTYWIVASTSAGDTSNHPNFGTNSAGGYSSGSVKYNNTADGWVAVSTIDLYFETLEGEASQGVTTNSSGKIESDFYSLSELPVPAFYQRYFYNANAQDGNSSGAARIITNATGSKIVRTTSSGARILVRDAKTGMYRNVNSSGQTAITPTTSLTGAIIGDFLYIVFDNGATSAVYRYDISANTIASETLMTISGTAPVATASPAHNSCFTNGRDLFIYNGGGAYYRYTISGTTLTNAETITPSSAGSSQGQGTIFDGNFIYVLEGVSNNVTVRKYNQSFTLVSTTIYTLDGLETTATGNEENFGMGLINIDSERFYICQSFTETNNATTRGGADIFIPFSKP